MNTPSDEQLKIINSISVPIAINDDQQNILFLNQAFSDLFGYTIDDVKHLDDWWPKAYPDKEYRAWVAKTWQLRMQKAKQANLPFEAMELKIQCKDGISRFALVSPAAMDDSLSKLHMVILVDISSQHQEHQKLIQSRNLLKTIINTVPIRIFWKDLNLDYMGSNDSFAQDARKETASDLVGLNDYQMPWKDNADMYRADDQLVMDTGTSKLNFEEPFLTQHGHTSWLRTSKVPLKDHNNSVCGILGTFENITQQRKQQAFENLRTQILEKISHQELIEKIFKHTISNIEQLFSHDFISIDLYHPDTHELKLRVSNHYALEKDIEILETNYDKNWQTGQQNDSRLILSDIQSETEDKYFITFAKKTSLSSYWAEPIFIENKLTAFIKLIHKDTFEPSVYDIKLIENIANLIGIAIQRKQTEDSLELADMVFQNTSEAIMITDSNHRILSINPAFTKIKGFIPSDVIGQTPRVLNSGRMSKDFYQSLFADLEENGNWAGEIWNRRKDGKVIAEWVNISTVYDKNQQALNYIALYRDLSEKKKTDQIIWNQANYDSLTKLPNRRLFTDRLSQEIKKAQRSAKKLALFYLDLDGFKLINDTLGHAAGDELLKQVAFRIENSLRETDTAARIGGDEFTIILPNLSDVSEAVTIADKVIQSLLPPFKVNANELNITSSVGITIYPDDATDVDSMIHNADHAMYTAKQGGKNRYGFFTELMHQTATVRLNISTDIRRALGSGEFEVYFQPIVNLNTGIADKAEALLRWNHPERGFISPVTFIPIAEETGTIGELGNWVFEQSVAFIAELRDKHQQQLTVSVNLSPAQFVNFTELDAYWSHVLDKYQVSGSSMVIEITEGVLLSADKQVTNNLFRLREMGMEIAIDDFGTGYSSLSYLKRLNVDFLKIDRSFIQNLGSDANDLALSEAITVMAHKLGLKVIAEGVETQAQRNILSYIGCNYIQGYLYSKPVPAKEFIAYLEENNPNK